MLRSMQSTGNKHQPIMQTRLCPTRSKNSYGQQRDNSDFECEVDARIAGDSHTERIGIAVHRHTLFEEAALSQSPKK